MEANNFSYCVHGFMHSLGLKPSELQVYAAIYSYTVGRVGIYYGSREYLAESVGYSERTVYRCLKRLCELGLIESVSFKGRYAVRCTPLASEKEKESSVKDAYSAPKEQLVYAQAEENNEDHGEECAEDHVSTSLKPEKWKNSEKSGACDEKEGVTPHNARESSTEFLHRLKKASPQLRQKIAMLGSSIEERNKHDAASQSERGRMVYNMLDDMYEERRSRSDKNDKYDIYNPKYVLLRFGRDDLVGLTKEQYYSLCCTAPTEVVEIYIARLEQLIRKSIEKGMDYSIHSHYRVIKKWMEEDLGEAELGRSRA